MKKNIYVSIICFFLLVMMFSGVMIYRHFKEAHTQAEIYDSLAEIVEESETNESVEATEGEAVMLPEYAKLYEQNSDIVGWIRIDDTQINYPVMQSPQEQNFYLKHGFDKEYTDYGCSYMSESCDVNKPSDNLIVYGHHMKNGTMFSDLEKFKSKDFWEEHKTLRFDTLYVKQTYEVIAVFKTAVYTGLISFALALTIAAFVGYLWQYLTVTGRRKSK